MSLVILGPVESSYWEHNPGSRERVPKGIKAITTEEAAETIVAAIEYGANAASRAQGSFAFGSRWKQSGLRGADRETWPRPWIGPFQGLASGRRLSPVIIAILLCRALARRVKCIHLQPINRIPS